MNTLQITDSKLYEMSIKALTKFTDFEQRNDIQLPKDIVAMLT
jgi:hypothetical protein